MTEYILGNRLIAFFDILGFSKKLENENLEKLHEQLSSFLDEVKTKAFSVVETKPDNIQNIRENFSYSLVAFDSILLVSNDLADTYSQSNFILSCIELIKIAGRFNFLLRGAIDLDEVFFDKERDIILSKAQPRLLNYEKSQNWLGCGVTNKACEYIWDSLIGGSETRVNNPILPYKIPCKDKVNLEGEVDFCLNWVVTYSTKDIEKMLNLLDNNKKQATKDFVAFVMKMDGFSQKLLPSAPPVSEFRYLATRISASFLFLDCDGNAVDPITPLKIMLADEDGSGAFCLEFKDTNNEQRGNMKDSNNYEFYKIEGNEQVEKIKKQILRILTTKSDLETTHRILNLILSTIDRNDPNFNIFIESMSVHSIISYTRCFNSSFSFPLNHDIFSDVYDKSETTPSGEKVISERMFHFLIMNYRNKHIAHSDDFLKAGDVGAARVEQGFNLMPIIAMRTPIEDKLFYMSFLRIVEKAHGCTTKRLEDLQKKLIAMLESNDAQISNQPSQITPIPLDVDVLEMWGLSES